HGEVTVTAIGAAHGVPFDDLVGGEIGACDQAAVRGLVIGNEPGGAAVVKFIGSVLLKAGKRGGQLRLAKNLPGRAGVAVAQEDRAGLGKGAEEPAVGGESLRQGG